MSMRKWKVIAPLGLAAVGALAAGVASLVKKPQEEVPAAAAAKAPAAPSAPAKALKSGSYSFISGYTDAATVELSLQYDPETVSFDVVGEDFLSYSSASHVAVIYSDDFNAQIEYVPYYTGEDFESFSKGIAEKYQGFGTVDYASLSGIKFCDGDNMCLSFPIPGDAHSYILVTLIQVKKDDDEPFTALPDKPAVRALLDTARISVQR